MRTLFLIAILLLTLGQSCAVAAQDSNVRLLAELSLSDGLGRRNPAYGATFGITQRIGNKVTLDAYGRFLRARKIPGDGFNLRGSAELRVAVSGPYFILGGLAIHRQVTTNYEKVGSDPFAGAGWESPDKRTYISGRLTFNDLTSLSQYQAKVRRADLDFHRRVGIGVQVEHYQPRSEKWGLYYAGIFNAVHFDCFTGANGPTAVCNGAALNLQIGVYRK